MKKLLKKLFSGVLSAALLLFTMPLALAANDLEGSWARPYILNILDRSRTTGKPAV